MILTKRGREYRQAAIDTLDALGLKGEMINCNVSVELTLNPPSMRRYDIDNFCKSLFDAMSKAEFWKDDSQIIKLSISKGEKTPGGNIQVKVNLFEELVKKKPEPGHSE